MKCAWKWSVGILFFSLIGCSSSSTPGPKRVEQEPGSWDYDQIRKTREAEKAQTPKEVAPEEESNCVVLTHEQMKRARVSGCRKVDPRSGQGEGSYCCPRE